VFAEAQLDFSVNSGTGGLTFENSVVNNAVSGVSYGTNFQSLDQWFFGDYLDTSTPLYGTFPGELRNTNWAGRDGTTAEADTRGAGNYWLRVDASDYLGFEGVACVNTTTGTSNWTEIDCNIGPVSTSTATRVLEINEPEVGYDIVTSDTSVDWDIDYVSNFPVAGTICIELSNQTTFQSLVPVCETVSQSGILNFSTTTVLISTNQYQWRVVIRGVDSEIIDATDLSFFTVEVPPYTPFVPGETGYNYGPLPAGTTSTSTLAGLTLECDPTDGFFSRSVCNLAVLLFVPSQTSLAQLNANINSLFMKQPFSAIVEFRTAWNTTVRNPTVVPQSLALTFYGEETDILSTSTLAGVAGSNALTTIRFLEVVGLWIAFAWFAFIKAKNFF